MRGVLAAGLAVALASSLVAIAVVASAVSLLGVGDDTPAATSAATNLAVAQSVDRVGVPCPS